MDSPPVKTVSTFISKLYTMLEDSTQAGTISWVEDGLSFKVSNPMDFQENVLPKYFKHNNFSSFVRQLNLYGFHKNDPHLWVFQHEDFVRGQKDSLSLIKRRTNVNEKQQQAAAAAAATAGTYYRDARPSSGETAELRSAIHSINERLQKQMDDNANMWKKLLATQAALQDTQTKFRRLLNLVGAMCMPEEDMLNTPSKRRATAAAGPGAPAAPATGTGLRAGDSIADYGALARPSYAQFDFSRPSQMNLAQALGRLSDTNVNLRALSSMRVIPPEFLTQLRSAGGSMTQLPNLSGPLNNGGGDPEYDQWMRELQESGMVDSFGNPEVSFPALQSVSQAALPMLGAGPSMSAFTSLLNPVPSDATVASHSGPANTTSTLANAANAPATRQPSMLLGSKRQREETDAVDAMVALRRNSVSNFPVQLSQTIKDQLRQLILEARVEEMQPPALQYPLVNPDDISIVNAVTPFASHGQGSGAVIGGPSFERIYALVNELVAECARVCAAHNIQGTLRQMTTASQVGVWVTRRPDVQLPEDGTAPREPSAVLLFK